MYVISILCFVSFQIWPWRQAATQVLCVVHVLCMRCDCEVTLLDGLLQLHVMHKEWHSWNVAVSMHPVVVLQLSVLHVQDKVPANNTQVSCIAMFTSVKVAV